ncbi:MAG: hypothetical protein R2851_07475 [Caldilineaceae bacterium]
MLGTDADAHRLDLARQLGADHTLNVQQDDPASLVAAITDEGMGRGRGLRMFRRRAVAQQLLPLVRRRGATPSSSLAKAVAWDLDQVCYKGVDRHGQRQRAVFVGRGRRCA